MKKKVLWLTGVLLVFVILAQCNTQTPNSIQQAKLTGAEQKMVRLLGGNQQTMVFNFRCEEKVGEILSEVWKLEGGKWQCISGQSGGFIGNRGRISVRLEETSGDLHLTMQSKKDDFVAEVLLEGALKGAREQVIGGWGTDIIQGEKRIVLDEKVPLCVWFGSTKMWGMNCFSVEEFENPQEYQYDDTIGYALTLRFVASEVDGK